MRQVYYQERQTPACLCKAEGKWECSVTRYNSGSLCSNQYFPTLLKKFCLKFTQILHFQSKHSLFSVWALRAANRASLRKRWQLCVRRRSGDLKGATQQRVLKLNITNNRCGGLVLLKSLAAAFALYVKTVVT